MANNLSCFAGAASLSAHVRCWCHQSGGVLTRAWPAGGGPDASLCDAPFVQQKRSACSLHDRHQVSTGNASPAGVYTSGSALLHAGTYVNDLVVQHLSFAAVMTTVTLCWRNCHACCIASVLDPVAAIMIT